MNVIISPCPVFDINHFLSFAHFGGWLASGHALLSDYHCEHV